MHAQEGQRHEHLLAEELDMDHSRPDFLHHVGDEVVSVTQAVRIPVVTWETSTSTHREFVYIYIYMPSSGF